MGELQQNRLAPRIIKGIDFYIVHSLRGADHDHFETEAPIDVQGGSKIGVLYWSGLKYKRLTTLLDAALEYGLVLLRRGLAGDP